jgi:hypothetical protein
VKYSCDHYITKREVDQPLETKRRARDIESKWFKKEWVTPDIIYFIISGGLFPYTPSIIFSLKIGV